MKHFKNCHNNRFKSDLGPRGISGAKKRCFLLILVGKQEIALFSDCWSYSVLINQTAKVLPIFSAVLEVVIRSRPWAQSNNLVPFKISRAAPIDTTRVSGLLSTKSRCYCTLVSQGTICRGACKVPRGQKGNFCTLLCEQSALVSPTMPRW